MPSRREAGGGGGGGGAMVGPSYGYPEEGVAGAPLPPLSKDVNASAAALPLKKGHRRHASFDPNTDCFSPHLSMGNGGISGPPGRGGVFPSIGGNDGHGYTGSVAGLGSGGSFGSSFGGNVGGGGSFGSSFTSNGRQHVRGCSSGSVDLNVLAPVLAEFRNGGGSGGGGAQQYPSLPPLEAIRTRTNPPSHHAQQPTPSQSTSQHHEERHEQQRQHASYQSPAAAAGDSHHPHSAGTLPVVTEPGTPPHILSDDTASAPSPKKAISQAHQHPNAHHQGAHQHPNSRQHSAHDGGDTELLHRHHHQHQHHSDQGFRGEAGGRHREETFGHASTARDYAQFYGEDHSPGDEQRQQHQRQRQHLPTSSGAVSVSGSPRWSGAKTPSSSLYAEAQGSASVDHLDSGRELHAGHVVGEGSTRIDGSRVDKGTIWIRHPEGMVNGGRRSFTPH